MLNKRPMSSNDLCFLRVTGIHPNSQVKTLYFSLYSSQALQLQSSDLQLAQCKTCLWFPSVLPILVHNNLLPRFCNTLLPSFPTSILALFQIISCTEPEGNFCSIGHILSLLHRTLNGFSLPSEQTQKQNLQALCDVISEYFFSTTSYTPALPLFIRHCIFWPMFYLYASSLYLEDPSSVLFHSGYVSSFRFHSTLTPISAFYSRTFHPSSITLITLLCFLSF